MGIGFTKRWSPMDALTKFAEDLTVTGNGTGPNDGSGDGVSAGGVVQIATVDRVIDLVGGRQDILSVVDVAALDITNNDELYTFIFQGSNEDDFGDATDIENLATLQLGATEVRSGGAKDSAPGRYLVMVSNEFQKQYRYMRLRMLFAGTTPSITFSAWLSRSTGF